MLLRPPVIVGSAILAALGGLLVSEYGPRALEVLEGDEALMVTAGYDADRYSDGWWMALPGAVDPSTAPAPGSSCEELRAWAYQRGGAHIAGTWLQMLVEGQRENGVVIKSMQARVLERSEPLNGSTVGCDSAGAVESISIGFDLDSPAPVAQRLNEFEEFAGPYFTDGVVSVAENETVPFSIVGRSESSFVRWVIDITVVENGEESVITVGDEGFLSTAEATSYGEHWTWTWWEPPARLVPRD